MVWPLACSQSLSPRINFWMNHNQFQNWLSAQMEACSPQCKESNPTSVRTWAGRWESLPGENWKRLEVWSRETFKDHLWKPPSVLCSALLPFLSANWAQPPWSWEVMGASHRLQGACLPVVGLGSVCTASGMDLRTLDGGGGWQEGEV